MKRTIVTKPLEIALKLLDKQLRILQLNFGIPLVLVGAVVVTLTIFQEVLYERAWYYDPFTVIIVALFSIAQSAAFIQFISYFRQQKRLRSLLVVIAQNPHVQSIQDVEKLSETITKIIPHSDERALVLNWLSYQGESTDKRNEELTNNSFIRMDLTKERTAYFHVMINRIILKLGFLGTLIGLMMTFPSMKSAILGLNNSNGEMTFIRDIAAAIDGDQYAILTTLIATALSLFAEFLTIQLIAKFAIDKEIVMSHLTDWYHLTIEPLYQQGAEESLIAIKERFEDAEKIIAKTMVELTKMGQKSMEHLAQLTTFQKQIEERVTELESYDAHYRSFIDTKQETEEKMVASITTLHTVAVTTSEQLESLVNRQQEIGGRVEELALYEEQYRAVLQAKEESVAPHHLRGRK